MENDELKEIVVHKKTKRIVPLKKIRVHKSIKIFGFSLLGLIGILVICIFINILFPTFGTFIWFNVRNPLYEIGFSIFQDVPKLGSNVSLIFLGLAMVFGLLIFVAENTRFFKYKNRVRILNVSSACTYLCIFLFVAPVFVDNAYLNAEKLNVLYSSEDVINKKYDRDDLVNLNNFLIDRIILKADTFERVDGAIVYEDNLVELAIDELKNSSSKYEFLKGKYPKNIGDFSERERKNNYGLTLGYTGNAGVVVDSYAHDVEELNTIMHEMCHVKGIIRESEAEYCAFLASVDSSNDKVIYSAYMAAFARTISALADVDLKLSDDISSRFFNLCYEKGYEEVCRFNIKYIDFYFKDADVFYGRGYKLNTYTSKKSELVNFLNKLKKYDLKIKINGKNIKLDKISNLVDSGSEDVLEFSILITEDNFSDVSVILNEYKTFFIAGYQEISEDVEDEEDERTSEEFLEYYLKPFDKTDIVLGEDYSDEYYYERATRFYLEYFDTYL